MKAASWTPVNDRIVAARFDWLYIGATIVEVYAPINDAVEEVKYVFYEQVQNVLGKIPKHDIVLLMGDWNAKVGDQQDCEERHAGGHELHGEQSNCGSRYPDHHDSKSRRGAICGCITLRLT